MTKPSERVPDSPQTASLRPILKRQYGAALTMLRKAVERCPGALWTDPGYRTPFWHVAYHAVFYAHLYLHATLEEFQQWGKHRADYQFLGTIPGPAPRPPKIEEPYTKEEVLEYLRVCEAFVEEAVDRMDLGAAECGFPWYRMGKQEHQFVSIRHIQHHAAQLIDRLRTKADLGVEWIGARPPA